MEHWKRRIPEGIREKQLEEIGKEEASVREHVDEAKRLVRNLLTRDAQILVVDVSQGGLTPTQVDDEALMRRLEEQQFGQGRVTHGEIFRNLLGFDPGDPRVRIWDVPTEDVRLSDLPYPDAFIVTGGPAMPSELNPGNETANTVWLRRAVDGMKELEKLGVPGVALCLGHQLWQYARGAEVGRIRMQREFGTVEMQKPGDYPVDLQLLYGFWNDEGKVQISASHSEGALTPPTQGEFRVIALNDYSDRQALVHPVGETPPPLDEALVKDQVVLSMQNHPEIMAVYLEALRHIRGEKIREEGLPIDEMIFRDTPNARRTFHRFIELAARRLERRK